MKGEEVRSRLRWEATAKLRVDGHRVPDLQLDLLAVDGDHAGAEFDACGSVDVKRGY